MFDEKDSPGRQSDIDVAIRAGMRFAEVKEFQIGEVPYFAVPEGVKLEDFEKYRDKPRRINITEIFEEPASFCQYAKSFMEESTRFYGYFDGHLINAVFDDHGRGDPKWRGHCAKLQLTTSPEWDEWMGAATKDLDQQSLADFFEEHVEQIYEPDASELLSGIRNISVGSSYKCVSAQQEGGDITCTISRETSAGIAQTTTAKIPSRLTLFIAPFRSWQQCTMTVFLTYRLANERLTFRLRPLRSQEVMGKAFAGVRQHVETDLGVKVLI